MQMASLKELEDERERWLEGIEDSDREIEEFEKALNAGEASLGRGLPYLRVLIDARAEQFRGLGNVEARIEYQTRLAQDQTQQDQDEQDKKDWKDRPETISAARVPTEAAQDDSDWWKKEPTEPQEQEAVASVQVPEREQEWWNGQEVEEPADREPVTQDDDDRYKR